MPRKTIIFGNGLGMALNPEEFSLDTAIGTVWHDDDFLDDASKQLITSCLPEECDGRPHGEDELDILQLALSACDFLSDIRGSRIHWLSEEGQQFPHAVRKFIYHTALQFHQCDDVLPNGFLGPLAEFINQTNSHVATLNYDNLLYQPLIEREVLKGYSGALVDGFHRTGFNADNMERLYSRNFGYYLHLHGSPLFIDRGNSTIKLNQCDLAEQTDTVSQHIVLTHFEHKPTVISGSEVLLSYWRKLAEAIGESEEVILVGYSGADDHLNAMIHNAANVPVRVVEWAGAGDEEARMEHWTETLAREVTLVRRENILEFQEW